MTESKKNFYSCLSIEGYLVKVISVVKLSISIFINTLNSKDGLESVPLKCLLKVLTRTLIFIFIGLSYIPSHREGRLNQTTR